MVCVWEPDTTIVACNHLYSATWTGKAPADITGQRWIDFVPNQVDRDYLMRHVNRCVSEKREIPVEHTGMDSAGNIVWCEWMMLPELDESGTVIRVKSVGTATERS
jgi:hypothetical protein